MACVLWISDVSNRFWSTLTCIWEEINFNWWWFVGYRRIKLGFDTDILRYFHGYGFFMENFDKYSFNISLFALKLYKHHSCLSQNLIKNNIKTPLRHFLNSLSCPSHLTIQTIQENIIERVLFPSDFYIVSFVVDGPQACHWQW